jgi:hypothetical protein
MIRKKNSYKIVFKQGWFEEPLIINAAKVRGEEVFLYFYSDTNTMQEPILRVAISEILYVQKLVEDKPDNTDKPDLSETA